MIEVVREFNVDEVKQIEVKLAQGDVQAAAAGSAAVLVKARVHAPDDAELKLALENGRLFAGHRSEDRESGNGDWRQTRPAIDIELLVPAGSEPLATVRTGKGDVRLHGIAQVGSVRTGKGDVSVAGTVSGLQVDSGAGDVAVAGCGGDLDIHTGAGDVAADGCQGAVVVKTGRGDVSIDGAAGRLEVSSGSGDISVANWQAVNGRGKGSIETGSGDIAVGNAQAGSLRLHTGRGDCSLGQVRLDTLELTSGVGDLVASGDPGAGRWQISTGKGDIVVKLPATVTARIEAATRHGDIHTQLPQVKVGRPGPISQHGGRTIIVIGDEPRAEVTVETGKGDIAVRTGASSPVVVGQPVAVAEIAASRALELPPSQPAPTIPTAPTAQPMPDRDAAMRVLESLARGEISVAEAEMLLQALA